MQKNIGKELFLRWYRKFEKILYTVLITNGCKKYWKRNIFASVWKIQRKIRVRSIGIDF